MAAHDVSRALLRLCARVEADAEQLAQLAGAVAAGPDWPVVVQLAEAHGVAPLAWRHLNVGGVSVPAEISRAFRGLVARHRHAARVRFQVLREIVDAFDAAGIDHVALKGAALAHVVYPDPELRPMRDIDLLVRRVDAPRAQDILGTLGFDVTQTPSRTFRFHHHLPPASCSRDGLQVSVEIHRDAFHPYHPDRLRLDRLTAPPRELRVAGGRLRTLGHVDMLRHLYRHTLEPAAEVRLIGVADIVGYAARFDAEIDWDLLGRRYPAVVNLLTLLHYVCPLPGALQRFRPAEGTRAPGRVGEGFRSLGPLARRATPLLRLLTELLYPSEWWMRAYYGVPPGDSLGRVRWREHVPHLGGWWLRQLAIRLVP